MKEKSESGGGGYVRADQIDLKSLDEQLQRHLSRAWTMEKNKNRKEEGEEGGGGGEQLRPSNTMRRQEWEIDPSKLIIRGVIARGTFGTVHRGIYDGQDVAVKLLDWGEEGHRSEAEIASLRAAFTQEVAVWHKLDHPNVTKFIGATMGSSELNIQTENGHIGMPSNVCCVVVEYCPGGALKSYLIKNRRRKLAFKVVIQLALDLARGLSYIHSKKIVHRDVKTENMLLDKTRTVKIADFGVARLEASNPHDMTGETGTLGYMAPENAFFILPLREGLVCNLQKHQLILGNPWSVVFGLVCWHLWKWRNGVVFDAAPTPARNRLSMVKSVATATTAALAEFDGTRVDRRRKEVLIGWRAPQAGWVCLNTDGAYKKSIDEASAGGVIRNAEGEWRTGFVAKLGLCSAYRAELRGVLHGLRLAWDSGFKKVMVRQ
ncbi:Kinase superfamily protein isoform 5 [Theobroma cacao]|uniref:Kinase superfamily protein isoform 5 n=1 Tax=Theobroma cacao TaxID=3641 RepID=A0A061EJ95_THECC|nr:Kinase superfamily protein isoform 5 [Theobroma cacao]